MKWTGRAAEVIGVTTTLVFFVNAKRSRPKYTAADVPQAIIWREEVAVPRSLPLPCFVSVDPTFEDAYENWPWEKKSADRIMMAKGDVSISVPLHLLEAWQKADEKEMQVWAQEHDVLKNYVFDPQQNAFRYALEPESGVFIIGQEPACSPYKSMKAVH